MSDTARTSRGLSGRLLLAAAMIAVMVVGIVAVSLRPAATIAAAQAVMTSVRAMGFAGVVLFAVLQAFVAVSGILPASLLGVAAGAFYGLVAGFLLAAASTVTGAVLAFLLTRSLFRPAIERMMLRRPRLQNLDTALTQDGWKLVCLLRISPVMPFAATSYLLGVSSVGLRDYTIGTLASLPALCGYVFLGTLANAGLSAWSMGLGPAHWVLLGVGIAATLALTLRIGQIATRLGLTAPPASEPHL